MQFRKRKVDGAGGHPLGILLLLLLLLLLFSGFLLSQRDEVGADETLRSPTLNVTSTFSSSKDKAASSGVEPDEPTNPTNPKAEEWTWFNGDLNQYYNKLERDEHAKRKPEEISSYAVHRWLGKPPNHSTLVHYQLVRAEIYDHLLHTHVSLAPSNESLRVFDAGCGLGAGLMWFEQNEPQFELVGHTISEDQYRWIVDDLPSHKFVARLRSFDEPLADEPNGQKFNVIYSIEAAVHSPDLKKTLKAWSATLHGGGLIILIDDYRSQGVDPHDEEFVLFQKSWLANSVPSTTEIAEWAEELEMQLIRDRDLGSEYQILKRFYRNKKPALIDDHGRVHQAWLGSKVRGKLMFEGKITYRLLVLQKKMS